jgi:hypothetical protein
MSKLKSFMSHVSKQPPNPRLPIVALMLAVMVVLAGGAVVATRSTGDRIANATFDKLGGDSHEILDEIADRVVKRITEKNGTLDSAQADLVDRLAGIAGKKFDGVDPEAMIADMRGQVLEAGLDKLDGISTDQIVAQVTAALIQQASAELGKVDVEKLAASALDDVVKSLNIEKLVKEKLDSIDVQEVVDKAVAKQLGSGGGWFSLLSGSP